MQLLGAANVKDLTPDLVWIISMCSNVMILMKLVANHSKVERVDFLAPGLDGGASKISLTRREHANDKQRIRTCTCAYAIMRGVTSLIFRL